MTTLHVTLIEDTTSSHTKTGIRLTSSNKSNFIKIMLYTVCMCAVAITPTYTEKSSELAVSSTATHKPSESLVKHSTTLFNSHLDIKTSSKRNSTNLSAIAVVTFLSAVTSFVLVAFALLIVKRQYVKNGTMCPWPFKPSNEKSPHV